MDGPVIAAASNEVLERGQRFDEALALVSKIARAARAIVAMTYYNLIYRHGLDESARALAAAGCAGAIIPDLSVEDSGEWRAACESAGIAPVFIAAQTSPPARLKLIGDAAGGFVYAASLLGVTGVRASLSARVGGLVSDIRAHTSLPVAVGIGVSTAEHAREAAAFADGVIVGSAVVARIAESSDPANDVREFVRELRAACNR
jgi:tryptophan synthase alpha chain